MSGHFNLGQCHMDVALCNTEAHDVGGVGAQLRSLEVERQAVLLQGRQGLTQGLEIPMLAVDNDAVDVYQDSW